VFSVAVSAIDGAVYAGTEPSALFRSDDGSETWRELTALLELPSRPTWAFPRAAVDLARPLDRAQLSRSLCVTVQKGARAAPAPQSARTMNLAAAEIGRDGGGGASLAAEGAHPRQTAAQGLAPVVSKNPRMEEKSLKDELRTALSPRHMRQPRNLLGTGPAMETEEQKKSPRERRPGLFARVFRRR
jgi:hypothetical protein